MDKVQWHDVSIPLRPEMAVWPGDPPFSIRPERRIAEGSSCNTSFVSFCTHLGTHCDAPWHFEDGGKKLHEVDPSVYFGEALLIDLPEVDRITAEHLPKEKLPARVLFKTRNSEIDPYGPFEENYVGLDPSASERLVQDGVRLVGIDYLSIAPYNESGPTHHILLRNDVFVIEGLRLKGFPAGNYPFTVLPLPLHDADGAPCRAFLGKEI